MVNFLDDPKILKATDKSGMLDVIRLFPESCERAIEAINKTDLGKFEGKQFDNLVIVGMGGSAVGGLLLRDWLRPTTRIPVIVSRDYDLPAFVSKRSLVFCVSYSGNTEETIAALGDVLESGASIICFSSGGRIEQISSESGLTLIRLPSGFQPRAAIAHQFFSLAIVAKKLGIVRGEWTEVNEAIDVLNELRKELSPSNPLTENTAKKLALEIQGYHPFVIGARLHEGVAYRWTTQFNENGKSPASSSFIPEAFHNFIMASEASKDLIDKTCVIILKDPEERPHISKKVEKFEGIIKKRFGKVINVNARGSGRLSRILSTLFIGDFTSAYLAILYGKDPSSINSIEELKRV